MIILRLIIIMFAIATSLISIVFFHCMIEEKDENGKCSYLIGTMFTAGVSVVSWLIGTLPS